MNPIKSLFFTGLLVLGAALPALGQAYTTYSFKVTNAIGSQVNYYGAPTNAVGTNGVATASGSYISVPNVDKGAITVSCTNSAGTSGTLVLQLVRSTKSSPPSSAYDFETTAQYVYTITLPSNTHVTWTTNCDTYCVGSQSYIGLIAVSNSCSSGYLTNDTGGPIVTFTPKPNIALNLLRSP